MQIINFSKISGIAVDSATKCLRAGVSSPVLIVQVLLSAGVAGGAGVHPKALLGAAGAERGVGHHWCPGPVCLWGLPAAPGAGRRFA